MPWEKIIVNVHGFSVLQQNFNRGEIIFLTKKFGHVVKKVEKPGRHRIVFQKNQSVNFITKSHTSWRRKCVWKFITEQIKQETVIYSSTRYLHDYCNFVQPFNPTVSRRFSAMKVLDDPSTIALWVNNRNQRYSLLVTHCRSLATCIDFTFYLNKRVYNKNNKWSR